VVEIGADSGLRVGRDLRQERERRGLTLEQVAKATRFSVRHLQSLEADLFDELPGGVLRKGLIRSYCQHLGVDDEVWVERFAASGAFENTEPDLAQFAENVHRARMEAMPPVRRRWWGVVVMVLGLLVLAFAAWHYVVKPRLGVKHHVDAPLATAQAPRELESSPIPGSFGCAQYRG
jgi:cytoskeleton protein RodZ